MSAPVGRFELSGVGIPGAPELCDRALRAHFLARVSRLDDGRAAGPARPAAFASAGPRQCGGAKRSPHVAAVPLGEALCMMLCLVTQVVARHC